MANENQPTNISIERVVRDSDQSVHNLPAGSDFESLQEAQEELEYLTKKHTDSEFVLFVRYGRERMDVIHRGEVLGDWNDVNFGSTFKWADILTRAGK